MTSSRSRIRRVSQIVTATVLLFSLCVSAYGGDFTNIPSDVRVTFSGAPLDHVAVGEPISAAITITNLGPGVVQSLDVVSSEFVDEWQLRSIDCNRFLLQVLDGTNGYSYKYVWFAVGTIGQVSELD